MSLPDAKFDQLGNWPEFRPDKARFAHIKHQLEGFTARSTTYAYI